MLVNVDIEGYISYDFFTPWKLDFVGSSSWSDSLKHDYLLSVTWLGDEWHVIIETWEKDVVVEWWVAGLLPFLPGAGVLSSGNEEEISGLEENTLLLVFLNLASVIEVNKDNVGTGKGDVIVQAVLQVLCFASVVVVDSVIVVLNGVG